MKFSLRLPLWQPPKASNIQGHFHREDSGTFPKIAKTCCLYTLNQCEKRNREEINFISLSLILVLFTWTTLRPHFRPNFHETVRGYQKDSILPIIIPTLSFKLRFSIAELRHFFCDHGSFLHSFSLKSEDKYEPL